MRQFGNVKVKQHGWLRRHNPFNIAIKNRLHWTLGIPDAPKTLIIPPKILNQGEANTCSEFGSYTNRSAVTGKQYVEGAYIKSEQAFTNDWNTTEFASQVVAETAVKNGFQAQDGTLDKPDAALWLYPTSTVDMYDTIQLGVVEYQTPIGVATPWYSSWESVQNGLIPNNNVGLLGDHWTTMCGKTTKCLFVNVVFSEPDRMTNANTWGTNAPGSDQGYYYFSRETLNEVITQGSVWIYSDDKMIKLLGKLTMMYSNVLALMGL